MVEFSFIYVSYIFIYIYIYVCVCVCVCVNCALYKCIYIYTCIYIYIYICVWVCVWMRTPVADSVHMNIYLKNTFAYAGLDYSLGVRCLTNVKSAGFWSQLEVFWVSTHTEEWCYNETYGLKMTIFKYLKIFKKISIWLIGKTISGTATPLMAMKGYVKFPGF